MSNLPEVAVVILSWNGKKFLEQFLPSVSASIYPNLKIYVADNASTDDTVPFLASNYPKINILKLDKNTGFAGGYNKALVQVKSDYYVLLNQDVEVTKNWIAPVIDLMETDKNIAACQPKIRAYYNKDYFEHAGAAGGRLDTWGYPFCYGRIFEYVEKDENQYNSPNEIFWATGACLFIRSELFQSIGGFDEDYFAHMEEIDLCWRLKNIGYKIMYQPASTVFHVGGGSLPKGNPKKTYLNFRNSLVSIAKNMSSLKAINTIIMRMILDHIAAYRALFLGLPKEWGAIARAHFYFFTHLPHILKKRNKIVRKEKFSKMPGVYNHSAVWTYYVLGKKTIE